MRPLNLGDQMCLTEGSDPPPMGKTDKFSISGAVSITAWGETSPPRISMSPLLLEMFNKL